ncbi:INO80 complex subunit D-like, partial [Asparagus officinalis]|uniref:INO80 complex subunit D-like n=1 Tax=Asparagus officinalis TaxID=4686 RepID=UPI00098E1B3A
PQSRPDVGEGPSGEAAALHQPQFLSREEVLRRRSLRAKKLSRVYRRHYWALIEEIRAKHRDYYWEFGKSPLEGEEEENEEGERKRCGTSGCKSKAMPLTTYCHQHILSDKKQTLYKGCAFATKSSQPKCGKPILRSTVPSLCHVHYQRNQRQISQALKKAGLNSSNKAPPKFHVLISECVRQIQARRREKLMATTTADKFFDSSLRTTDTREMRVIGKKPPPVEKKFTSLRGRLQDSVGRMMASSPDKAQLSPSMTKVK